MMKQEFEELIGYEVPQESYDKIEYVYAYNDFFENKQQIANFYKFYDMNGIERMYRVTVGAERVTKEIVRLQDENAELLKENEKLNKKMNMFRNSLSEMLK